MKAAGETQRTIIENVSPEIDCGKYPAKRVVGEPAEITADVFTDGHDAVRAVCHYRKKGKSKWIEQPMKFLGNDRWQATFVPEEQGFYEFTIEGWVDHFLTWQDGLRKKFEAGQDVSLELKIGAQLIEETATRAKGADKKKLEGWKKKFTNPKDISESVNLAISTEVSETMYRLTDRSNTAKYGRTLTIEVDRKKALFSTWYEFFPRSASKEPGKHGTFKDCEALLPRIANMGFDVIYLPPIHPIGKVNRKGKNNSLTPKPDDPGSPWAIGSEEGGHKAIHAELGTLEDFMHLVKVAKEEYGIEIALDIAFQCAPDHPYVKEHPQWFKWRPDGTVQYAENPPKKYQDVLPLNFENDDWKNLWKELKSVFTYWIEQGVNIFRVDNPHTKPFNFWEWAIAEIKKEYPDTIFLAEAFTRPRIMERLGKLGYTQSYTYFTWRTTKAEFIEYMTQLTQTNMRNYYRPNFWPNTPDILPEHLQHAGDHAFIQRVILAGTLSSNYGLYGPAYEFADNEPFPGKEENNHSEKYEIKDWDWDKRTRIMDVITILNKARKENPALQSTWNLQFAEIDNDQLLAYVKQDEASGNIVLTVVNLDPDNVQSGWLRLPLQHLNLLPSHPYKLHDVLSGATYTWDQEWNYVELNPKSMPAHIMRIEQDITQ